MNFFFPHAYFNVWRVWVGDNGGKVFEQIFFSHFGEHSKTPGVRKDREIIIKINF